jgi:hypothetical protein
MASNVPVKCEGRVVGRLSGRGKLSGSVTLAGGLVFVRLDDEDREEFWAEVALDLGELLRAVEAERAEREATRTIAACSWCHAANDVTEAVQNGQPVFCGECGHRADVCRRECDCEHCRNPKPPVGPTMDDVEAALRELEG